MAPHDMAPHDAHRKPGGDILRDDPFTFIFKEAAAGDPVAAIVVSLAGALTTIFIALSIGGIYWNLSGKSAAWEKHRAKVCASVDGAYDSNGRGEDVCITRGGEIYSFRILERRFPDKDYRP